MKDIKEHIFSKLTSDTELQTMLSDGKGGYRVYPFADDSEEMSNFSGKFPQITYARISGTTNHVGTRIEMMQISSWSHKMKESEELNTIVVQIFNRTSDDAYKNAKVIHIDDTFDSQTKTFGIHSTIQFVIHDDSY